VRILLEPVGRDPLLSFIRSCFDNREPGAIATLIFKSNGLRLPIATRLFWQSGLKFANGSPDSLLGNLLPVLSKEIELSLRENRSRSVVYETPQGDTEFFVEVIQPPTALMIFGAGHDAIPLSSFAKQLGWQVTVVDQRSAYAAGERFPAADRVLAA